MKIEVSYQVYGHNGELLGEQITHNVPFKAVLAQDIDGRSGRPTSTHLRISVEAMPVEIIRVEI